MWIVHVALLHRDVALVWLLFVTRPSGRIAFREVALSFVEQSMPVFAFPEDPAFDSKTRLAVEVAYEKAIKVLGLNARTGLAIEFVTAMIMSVAYSGVSDPDTLCDFVVQEMQGRLYLPSTAAVAA